MTAATPRRSAVRCSANADVNTGARTGRRSLGAGLAATSVAVAAAPALAIPGGFTAVKDVQDNYALLYPNGWEEVKVDGIDVVYKDLIEPLESVSVTILPTETEVLSELGSPEEVAPTFIDTVLSSPNTEYKILGTKQRTSNGRLYYTFQYAVAAPSYLRIGLSTISVRNGKFYVCTVGCDSKRYNKLSTKLETVADSFENLV